MDAEIITQETVAGAFKSSYRIDSHSFWLYAIDQFENDFEKDGAPDETYVVLQENSLYDAGFHKLVFLTKDSLQAVISFIENFEPDKKNEVFNRLVENAKAKQVAKFGEFLEAIERFEAGETIDVKNKITAPSNLDHFFFQALINLQKNEAESLDNHNRPL